MAYLIQEFFEQTANAGIDITKLANRLTELGLGFNDILGDEGEKLCVAKIRYIQNTWVDGPSIKDIDLDLIDTNTRQKVNFSLSGTEGNKAVSIDNEDKLDLSFVSLLSSADSGVQKQREILSGLLTILDHVGYTFNFEITEADPGNALGSKRVVTITAEGPDGNIVKLNEILVKYGACKYCDLGATLTGGGTNTKLKMKDLDAEARREKNGITYGEQNLSEIKAEEKRLKPSSNYKALYTDNSKLESNKHLEYIFENETEDSNMFKIGDVWLQIPPTHITVSQMRNSYTLPLLGLESKPVATPVNRTIIKLNVVFTEGQVTDDMIRILTQFRYCPINLLRSKDLFNRLAGSNSFLARDYARTYYIPVTMDQYTLFNVDGHPGTISCVLQFSVFNHAVYLPDNPNGLEYYEKNNNMALVIQAMKAAMPDGYQSSALADKAMVDVKPADITEGRHKTKTTWRLEEAEHPYNANIENRLKVIKKDQGTGGLFDMDNSKFQIWKVDMDGYFNNTKGIPDEMIDVDKEKNMDDFLNTCVLMNPLFTEVAQSISVTYNNIFAYQPLLSQSQPAAQYVGPGETVVSVNLKGINMSTEYFETGSHTGRTMKHDQRMIGNLLKTWAETNGRAQYGFFDDRYFVRSTLLNLADVNIVSIQNTVATSVESKPGLFDVNILFSKSMFEYNLRGTQVSAYDPYFGLRRMTSLYGNEPAFIKLAKKVNDLIKAQYSVLEDRMAPGLTISGMNTGLRTTMNEIFTAIKKKKQIYYQGGVKYNSPGSNRNQMGTRIKTTSNFTPMVIAPNKIKLSFVIEDEKINLAFRRILPPELVYVIPQNKKYSSKFGKLKWINEFGFDLEKNGVGQVYVEITAEPKYINMLKGVDCKTEWQFVNTGADQVIDQDIVYKNLTIAMNRDSYDIFTTDTAVQAEEKAKYSAFATLINQIKAGHRDFNSKAPFGASPPDFKAEVNGQLIPLWENKEFMDQFYEIFLVNIGRKTGAYETSGGGFKEDKRISFIRDMMADVTLEENQRQSDAKQLSGAKSLVNAPAPLINLPNAKKETAATSESNHYHYVTGNGILLEYDNPLYNITEPSMFDGVDAAALDVLEKVDKIIKEVGAGKISQYKWQHDTDNDRGKWYCVILSSGIDFAETEQEDKIAKAELAKPENQDTLATLESNAKKNGYLKPYSCHRYFPFVDGFVGWSQMQSASMGSWFVCEPEEETVYKVLRIKENQRKATSWSRDMKLFDKNSPNSAALRSSGCSGMLDYIDITDPLSVMAAIARPKMLRDTSAAYDAENGINPNINFLKKVGTFLFGEDASANPESTNQTFNSVSDWLMYSDGKKDVDYIGVKRTLRAQELEKDLKYQDVYVKDRTDINNDQEKHLVSKQVNRALPCADVEDRTNLNNTTTTKMVQQSNHASNGSVIAGKTQVPHGMVTGQTQADAGIQELGYSDQLKNSTHKVSTSGITINGGHSAARTGQLVEQGVLKDKDGNPDTSAAGENKIPDNAVKDLTHKKEIIEGDKIANILTNSYIEGLQSTRGLQNVFPTYKMYIIKSDTSEYKFSSMDDYWDYRLVQDIMVVRDKNTPVHMLKARVIVDPRYVSIAPDVKFRTGVEGRLYQVEENHTQVPVGERDSVSDAKVFYKDKAPLRAGMRICIKMGYHSDPRYLDTVFIGTITQLNGSLDSGQYDLAAEGDGRELRVPAVNFSEKFTADNYTDIINAIMRINPNVIHFGKSYGSFLRRLSYGHKNLAQMGMIGLSAVGAMGASVAGIAVPGGVAAWGGKKMLTFSGGAIAKLAAAGGVAGVVAGGVAAAVTLPIAFGEFSQAGQWFNPAMDELFTRKFTESDFYQDWNERTHKTLTIMGKDVPLLGELDGLVKGNIFNANKQAYQLSKHFYQTYKHGNNPLDDNIFAVDIWNSMTKRASLNVTNRKSIWDVLQTVRRMYPNYALDIRPYGSRSTIFLGPVGFNYWRTDDPVQAMLPQLNQMEGLDGNSQLISKSLRKGLDLCALPSDQNGDTRKELSSKISEGNDEKNRKALGLTRAPFIPFQKHHLITSEEDIIMNGLKPTPERGWNAVVVSFGDDPNNIDPKNTIEFMADTDLYPEAVIKRPIHIDFTKDPESATRYALGFLKEGVERLYGGTIIIKGNSKIEPYDKVYISDSVNKMYGWVQVETVIHKFDQEMGFTTHIVPNMVCEINNNAYLTTQDIVMSTLYEKYFKNGGFGDLAVNTLTSMLIGGAIGSIGLGMSPLFVAGMFIYQGITLFNGFKSVWDSYRDGRTAATNLVGQKQQESFANSEKTMLHEIIATSIEADATMKGLKYGWVLGYLKQRGALTFLNPWSEKTLVGMLTKSYKSFSDGIADKIRAAGSTIGVNFGSDSAVNSAWRNMMEESAFKAEMRKIEAGRLAEISDLKGPELKAAQEKWDAAYKELQKSIKNLESHTGDAETAKPKQKVVREKLKALYDMETPYAKSANFGNRAVVDEFDIVNKISTLSEGRRAKGVISSGASAVSATASKGFGAASSIFKKVMGSGAMVYLTFGMLDFMPQLGYSFAVKAVTKNNVMLVSPIYWRDTYLMPALDGYYANDTFTHINDMLVNVNNTLDEGRAAVHNYLPHVFPIDSSKQLQKALKVEGVASVAQTAKAEMLNAGSSILCTVKNSGLPGLPTNELNGTSSSNKWPYIINSVNRNNKLKTELDGKETDLTVFMLSLMYNETKEKFSLNEVSPTEQGYGLCQIQTGTKYSMDDVLSRNSALLIYNVASQQMKQQLVSGDYKDALTCKDINENVLDKFIEFSIKSMAEILHEKWKYVWKYFLKDPNNRIAKARAASKTPDIIDAVLLYGAYVGLGTPTANGSFSFVDQMINSDFIKNDGTVKASVAASAFKGYTSQKAIWQKNGFLDTYLAMRASFLKCDANNKAQASTPVSAPKPGDKLFDFSAASIKKYIFEVASGWTNKPANTFTTSNRTVKGTAQQRDPKNQIYDCSTFVGKIVEDATRKYISDPNVKKGFLDISGATSDYSNSKVMATKGKQVGPTQAVAGDLVFYRATTHGPVKHVEIYMGNNQSLGTSDIKGSFVLHDITKHPSYGSNSEIRSYFNY